MRKNPARCGPRSRRAIAMAMRLACVGLALGPLTPVRSELPPAAEAERAAAVAQARVGDYAGALEVLETLHSAHPDETSVAFDLIAVLGWAERNERAVELALTLSPDDTPDYVQLAVAKAARNIGRLELAARWYESAAAARPDDVDTRLGLLLTRAEQGDREAVEATLGTFGAGERDALPVALARAHALRMTGSSLAALVEYGRVLEADPGDREALRGRALTLRSMLLPTQALELAARHPGILTDEEIDRLRVDELAIRVRLSARTPYPESVENEAAAETLAALDQFLATSDDGAARVALEFDRIVALVDRDEAEAAVAAFEALDDRDEITQTYVLGAVGNAYLQVRRPADALQVLDAALRIEPGNLELRFSKVYALLELERYADAFALTESLASELPLVNARDGSAVVKGNEDRMRAELLAGIAEAYGDQLAAAQARFEGLLALAPNNHDLRHELANVYRWRGWLDRSLFEYRQVLAVDEELLSAQIGHAHAQMDAHDYRSVDATLQDIRARHPAEPATLQLSERWRVHNERELDISGTFGESSGPTFGTDYYSIDTRYFTRPIAYVFRGYVQLHDAFAEFPEGDGRRRRIGIGVEHRGPRWTASGGLSGARDGDGGIGARGEVEWRASDNWSVAGVLELDSDTVQLRAERLGIEADLLGMSVRYARHESASVDMGWRYTALSDDNRQRSVFADGRYRISNRPRSKLDVTAELEVSRSDRKNVAYYSPSRDANAVAGLSHELRLYRRYERSLTQTITLAAGRHRQSDYASGSVWTAGYALSLRLSNSLVLGLGAERAGQLFDGAREHTTVALATVNARF